LSSLNHGKPDESTPDEAKGKSGVHVSRKTSLLGEDQSHNDGRREDQQTRRVNVLDHVADLLAVDITFTGHLE
jgi:hypothetical protein